MKQYLKRDLPVILGLLTAAGLLYLLFFLTAGAPAPADYVLVRIDGEEAGRFPLSIDREVSFDTIYGHNTLVISNGEASMTGADCPDGYCLTQSSIKKTGERIVCLPHRLIAEAIQSEEMSQSSSADGKESGDRPPESSVPDNNMEFDFVVG